MRIVLLGATGLVGSHLLAQLLSSSDNNDVLVLGRTAPVVTDKRITFIQSDLSNKTELLQILTEHKEQHSVDILISCLGTTIKAAGSKQAFFRVDHDLILNTAGAARQYGIERMMLVSAINADAKSRVFYSKVKGQTEQDLISLGFKQLILIKPSLLMGSRGEFRLAESFSAPFMKLINPLLTGAVKKYRAIEGGDVAKCMVEQLKNPKQGVLEVYPADFL